MPKTKDRHNHWPDDCAPSHPPVPALISVYMQSKYKRTMLLSHIHITYTVYDCVSVCLCVYDWTQGVYLVSTSTLCFIPSPPGLSIHQAFLLTNRAMPCLSWYLTVSLTVYVDCKSGYVQTSVGHTRFFYNFSDGDSSCESWNLLHFIFIQTRGLL